MSSTVREIMEMVYYIRDEKTKRPMITVVIIHSGEEWVRGISICSERDNPEKVDGYDRARGRAIKALMKQKSFYPVNRLQALMSLYKYWPELPTEAGSVMKSDYMPELTSFEKKLLRIKG